jgi:hypothetical protein
LLNKQVINLTSNHKYEGFIAFKASIRTLYTSELSETQHGSHYVKKILLFLLYIPVAVKIRTSVMLKFPLEVHGNM